MGDKGSKMAEIVDKTKYKAIEIEKLVKADWNYKDENQEMAAKLAENIKRNGQIENILVRLLDTGFYEVVNGNHRLDALKAIGATKVMCYDLGAITAQQAYRIAIETNETKFNTDIVKLAGLVSEIANGTSMEDLVATMPFTTAEVENFIGMASFSFDKYKEGENSESGADASSGSPRISFIASPEVQGAWREWQERCAILHPDVGTDEGQLLKALAAALDYTDTDQAGLK